MSTLLLNISVKGVAKRMQKRGVKITDRGLRKWFLNQQLFADDTALAVGLEFGQVCIVRVLQSGFYCYDCRNLKF